MQIVVCGVGLTAREGSDDAFDHPVKVGIKPIWVVIKIMVLLGLPKILGAVLQEGSQKGPYF